MGNISDIFIDINNISDELLKYSIYDVLFLKYLYLNFLDIDNDIYKNIIPDMTKLIFLQRREVINITDKLDKIIFILNIATIDDFNDTLQNIFTNLLFVIYDKKIIKIFKINYFKKYFINFLKAITYNILINKYKIKMPNGSIFNGYLNIGSIFTKLRELGLSSIFKLLNQYKESSMEYLV